MGFGVKELKVGGCGIGFRCSRSVHGFGAWSSGIRSGLVICESWVFGFGPKGSGLGLPFGVASCEGGCKCLICAVWMYVKDLALPLPASSYRLQVGQD